MYIYIYIYMLVGVCACVFLFLCACVLSPCLAKSDIYMGICRCSCAVPLPICVFSGMVGLDTLSDNLEHVMAKSSVSMGFDALCCCVLST